MTPPLTPTPNTPPRDGDAASAGVQGAAAAAPAMPADNAAAIAPDSAAAVLTLLQDWRTQGWLRALDLAFARFLHALDPQAPPSLLLAAALLTQLEGRGHSCMPLGQFLQQAQALLAWPAEAAAPLDAALAWLPATGAAAAAAWSATPTLQFDPPDDHGATPLVLQGDRLCLRRYWRHERHIATQVLARTSASAGLAVAGVDVDITKVRALLRQLFPAQPQAAVENAGGHHTIDWQQIACALALRGRLTLVTGGPGTGKTYTAARLLVLLQALHAGPQPLRVALAAPTGKAAARLRQSIDVALQALTHQLHGQLPLATWAAQLGPGRTLHGLLGSRPDTRRFRHDAANPLDVDLLFVDEASMVHLEMMAALLDAVPATARIVLLGDKDQLASVEAGAVMGDLCHGAATAADAGVYDAATVAWLQALTGATLPLPAPTTAAATTAATNSVARQTVVLRHSRRFAGAIGQLALAVNRGDGRAALGLLRGAPDAVAGQGGSPALQPLRLLQTRDPQAVAALAAAGRGGAGGGGVDAANEAANGAANEAGNHAEAAAGGGYRSYLDLLARRPTAAEAFDTWALQLLQRFDGFRVLCALRDGPWGVSGLNASIERALSDQHLLHRRGEWYAGRPVMVTRNDPALGVFNGDIGLVLPAPGGGPLRAWFADGGTLRSVAVGRLADVETAFAMTVHKSQGSEFGHVALVLPEQDNPVLTRELVYTGITRARQALTLVSADPHVLVTACGRLTHRLSGLRAQLAGAAAPVANGAALATADDAVAALPAVAATPAMTAPPRQPDLFD